MTKKFKTSKALYADGLLLAMAVLAGGFLFSSQVQAAASAGQKYSPRANPLRTVQRITNLKQPEGDAKDNNSEQLMQSIDSLIENILADVDEHMSKYMPEGYENGGSLITSGDTIARQVDGVWEFSEDGGQTWTDEAPEGFEASEDGTRFKYGGGSLEDLDEWLKEWDSYWNEQNNSFPGKQSTSHIL